jgi:ribokinase
VTGRVIVVGSVNIDLVIAGARLPGPGETVLGGTFQRFHGGKGGNQAVAAARLGAQVAFIGAVGDDTFGEDAREALTREGIDVSSLARLEGVATGVALILVDPLGENVISVASGANGFVTPALVEGCLRKLEAGPADIILVGHEIPTLAVRAAIDGAHAVGARAILNPAPAAGVDRELLALADLVTPNRGEVLELGRMLDPDAVSEPAAFDAVVAASRSVLVSLGPDGAKLVHGDDRTTVSIEAPVVDAVDAVGAGDTLNGALAAGLAEGRSIVDAARRAVAAASLSVTRPGARDGMPTSAELEAALRR